MCSSDLFPSHDIYTKIAESHLIDFIELNKTRHTIKKMCITLGVPRSSYYEKINRKTSKTEIRREEIKKEVKSIYKDSKCRYGAPKIHKVLESKDVKCSVQLVQRIMKSEGIKSIAFKKYKHQNSKPNPAPAGNILSREFEAKGLGEKIVGDITYIKTEKDGLYRDWETDRKSTRLNSSHITRSRMPSSA